jgi:hypothetical protein
MVDMDTSEYGDEEEVGNYGTYGEDDVEGDSDDKHCEEGYEHYEDDEECDEDDEEEPASRSSSPAAVDLSAFKATALQCKAPATRKNYERWLKKLVAELPRY